MLTSWNKNVTTILRELIEISIYYHTKLGLSLKSKVTSHAWDTCVDESLRQTIDLKNDSNESLRTSAAYS